MPKPTKQVSNSSIRFLWALRDPGAQGDLWIWRHPTIELNLLSLSLKQIQKHAPPSSINSWTADDCLGGYLTLDENWSVFYRYFNGGKDLQGRPDRYVLLIGVVERPVIERTIIDDNLLKQGQFRELAQQQPLSLHIPLPTLLAEERQLPQCDQRLAKSLGVSQDFTGPESFQNAWNEGISWPSSSLWHLKYRHQTQQEAMVTVTLLPPTEIPLHHPASPKPASLPRNRLATIKQIMTQQKLLTRLNVSLIFLVSLVGFTSGLLSKSLLEKFFGNGIAATSRFPNEARTFIRTYETKKTGQLIPRDELLERIDHNNWGIDPIRDVPPKPR